MDEQKFRELYEEGRGKFILEMQACNSPEELSSLLIKKGLHVELSEASKILTTVNSFQVGRISDEDLSEASGGKGMEFINDIISALLP